MKKTSKFLAVLLALGMLLSLGACGFNFADPVQPADFDNPVEYYRTVESNNAMGLMTLALLASQVTPADNVFTQGELLLSLDQSVLDPYLVSMVTQAAGMDLSWFESVGLGFLTGVSGDLNAEKLTLRVNGTDIANLEAVLDKSTLIEYLTIPELSPISFSLNLAELVSQNLSISPEELTALLSGEIVNATDLIELANRYFNVVLSNIDKVDLADGTVSAGGVEAPCTIAQVTIDGETMLKIAKSALGTARYDQKLETLIYYGYRFSGNYYGDQTSFHDDYDSAIQRYLDNLESKSPEDIEGSVLMTVYIDGEGTILGRTINILSEGEQVGLFSYVAVPDGDRVGVDLSFASYNSGSYSYDGNTRSWEYQTVVNCSGSAALSAAGAITGDFLVSFYQLNDYNGGREETAMDLFKVDLDFSVGADGIQGEAVLTPCDDLMNKLLEELDTAPQPVVDLVKSLSLAFVVNGANGTANVAYVLRSNGQALLTLGLTASEAEPFAISIPADVTDPDTWTNSIGPASLNAILNNLLAAGIPAELINSLTN